MSWQQYSQYIYLIIPLWLMGISFLFIFKRKQIIGKTILIVGTSLLLFYTIDLWTQLGRPPFRTLSETRLWYSICLAIIGLFFYFKWEMLWLLTYSYLMSILFLLINYFHPETYDQTLMPALQSPWFIPHVIVYMIAYALLTAAAIISAYTLFFQRKIKNIKEKIEYADNTVFLGFAFLSFGLLFGALWAKQAWGHYWTWDPKETWALISWLVYLLYIHYRFMHKDQVKIPLWILIIAMVFILICWFGVNYLSVASNSVHTYTS